MKLKSYTILFMITGVSLLSTSCKKKGCMDKYADNYSSKAEKDDGSCSYTKGALLVKAEDGSGNPIHGEEVWIYNSQQNFDSVIPMAKLAVDANGQAIFTNLAPGHYWADCDWTSTSGANEISQGDGDVVLGKQTTLIIKP